MYSECVDRYQSGLEQLDLLLLFVIVSVHNHSENGQQIFIDLFPRFVT